jgi:hypothetical protein
MRWFMKYCARGALGLGAAALLLSGIPARANPLPGAPETQFRENQPCLLAQSSTQPRADEQVEKRRLEEQQKKAAMEKQQQQQSEPKRMRTRGAIPEAVAPPPAGRGRFGAGVIRDKETKEVE